jgi:glycosyltransferase involved in cell wall biosynthesis/predicted SAM-dependent methyltransferase
MQGAQTESRFRGIGRYTLSLAQNMVRNRGEHEIILVVSGLFPSTIEFIRAAFDGLLPQENIRVWYASGPVRECEPDNTWRREAAERIREAFLASLQPDVVLVTSLFEGFLDDAVTSIGVFAKQIPSIVILYDLIPLNNPETYLKPNPCYKAHYLSKIENIKKATGWLAISEFAALEGRETLNLGADSVISISSASDPIFRNMDIGAEQKQQLLKHYGINHPFVMYSGGSDSRKNLPRLIRAYANLPQALRKSHQLLIVGTIPDSIIQELKEVAYSGGMRDVELIFTGYVNDRELAQFYNLCKLFVFPSWHEGFGLTVLEAMSCGAAVIGSNTTSLPEVINKKDALFDPFSTESIAQKIAFALQDLDWLTQLREHGLRQAKKFSWDTCGKRAMAAIEVLHAKKVNCPLARVMSAHRPKLAYVSPLPPMRSGISDYSSELLPVLALYYDIEVIVSQQAISDPWINANCPIRSVVWFQQNASVYDRVLYHFGNSPFHSHLFGLLRQHPGVVMLHDFFLSGVLAHDEMTDDRPRAWVDALFQSHGYQAVQMRFSEIETHKVIEKYPANLEVLQNALGVIVHSQYSKYLARKWYGENASDSWNVIPLLRVPALKVDNLGDRISLNLKKDDFIICSFGLLDPNKLNQRLLDVWLKSSLSKNEHCKLVFVGENHGGEYGAELLKTIKKSGLTKRISITGWADSTVFRQYLAVADIAVQLRTLSRGETSAAALDCMNYGLPTIVNANGSMADLPRDAVWMLPDEFTDAELAEALESLWQEGGLRKRLADRAREVINTQHNPGPCANQYALAIESMYQRAATGQQALLKSIAASDNLPSDNIALELVAKSLAATFLPEPLQRQLLIDVSSIVQLDLKSGIERVVRAQLLELINNPPSGFRVEPVYLTDQGGQWHYRYARIYTSEMLGIQRANLCDEPIDISRSDVFFGLDYFPEGLIEAAKSGIYLQWKAAGLSINFLVYDLLPVLRPGFFPEGASIIHGTWLKTIAEFSSRLICISYAVADELRLWLDKNTPVSKDQLIIDTVHLGADIIASAPTTGLPDNAEKVLKTISATPTFIMVGTIEPRKGYLQTLAAFDLLWDQGQQINLIIVGKEGWKQLPNDQRRTIPQIVKKLRKHRETGSHLFWLEGISDEYLEKIYAASACLIAASEGEGFGLPLIEAAQHGLPIIARDIPVFREVAQQNAYYFNGLTASDIAVEVSTWLNLKGNIPMSTKMHWNTWEQVVQKLTAILLDRKDTTISSKLDIKQKAIDEHLNLIHAARVAMVSTLLPQGDYILDLGGANCPLYKMGYPYHFKKLTLIDLPPDQRHDYYKDVVIDSDCPLGPVVVRYTDMTTLEGIDDESVDFVWSGQSIEHVPLEAGVRMCREAFRVLRKGGAFCLDTPNRRLTEIHTATVGGGFIHPEHYIEYHSEHLLQILKATGFSIENSYGICEMPLTIATGEFHYEDFMFGKQITDRVSDGYIQFFHCMKP